MGRYHTIPLTMTDEEIDIYLADMQEEEFHFLESNRMRKENAESFRKLDRSTAQIVDDLFKAFTSGTKQ